MDGRDPVVGTRGWPGTVRRYMGRDPHEDARRRRTRRRGRAKRRIRVVGWLWNSNGVARCRSQAPTRRRGYQRKPDGCVDRSSGAWAATRVASQAGDECRCGDALTAAL